MTRDEFQKLKEELSTIYEKINAMSENIAVLRDRSDRGEKTDED